MKRKQCVRTKQGDVLMTADNLLICLSNQQGSYTSPQLNQSLHLQYYGFVNMDQLVPFCNLNTLFLNNNLISNISALQTLTILRTLNLSHNRITQIKGLNTLNHLHTLDLSHNLITHIPKQQLQGLNSLATLKLTSNQLAHFNNIAALQAVPTLTCLDLSANQSFTFDPLLLTYLNNSKLSVLSLMGTLVPRSVPNYRKQLICACTALMFLDDRPVSSDQRVLAMAWQEGGLVKEKEVRNQIKEQRQEKSDKIYSEIEERNRVVEGKRKMVLEKLTIKETERIRQLKNKLYKQSNNQTQQQTIYQENTQKQLNLSKQSQKPQYSIEMSLEQRRMCQLQIKQLQRYLQLMAEQVCQMDLDKQLRSGQVQLPTMLIDKETPEAVYVYNVQQQQLPLIKQNYYPYETRPLIAVSTHSPAVVRWVEDYDTILSTTSQQVQGNMSALVAAFNLAVYSYDRAHSRKIKRFQMAQLEQHLQELQIKIQQRMKQQQSLDQLD